MAKQIRVCLSITELNNLRGLVSKTTNEVLLNKLDKKLRRADTLHNSVKRKQLYKLHKIKQKEHEESIITIPLWLFEQTAPISPCTDMEAITIDMVNRFTGKERREILKGYYDWKVRQKEADKKVLKYHEGKIYRLKVNNTPKLLEMERRCKHNFTATVRLQKKLDKQVAELETAKRKAYNKLYRDTHRKIEVANEV